MRAIFIIAALYVFGCGKPEKSASRDDNVLRAALDEGNRISALAQRTLGGRLKKALSEGGPVYAVDFCNIAAYPILDSLQSATNVSIRRASHRYRNPKDKPTQKEAELIDRFSKDVLSGDGVSSIVEVLNKDQIMYAKAIVLDSPLCLSCHGQVGTEIAPETAALLQQLYPEDRATNHKLGDLRGIWSITFDQSDL